MKNNDYMIRLESKNDYREVETLVREAFWNQNVPGCHEHYFVHMLRKHPDFIPALDFVLEQGGRILACVMYEKGKLIDENGTEKPILTMGPLCVLPGFQRHGFGKALLEHSFIAARQLGYDVVINFGNPDNYVARGYKSCRRYNVCFGDGFFPAALLVKELCEGALDGRRWQYVPSNAEGCCDDEAAVAAFDAQFPPKVKGWQPSKEEFYIHSHSAITW